MNRISAVIKMHLRDKFTWFALPWIILLCSFSVNLFISFLTEEPIYTGGLASIFIYMLVAGIITVAQTFPFALSIGLRRTDYFMGTAATILAGSAITSIVLFLFALMENGLGGWGTDLHFFDLPYLSDGPALGQLWIFFILLVHTFFAGFSMSSLHRRFGSKGLYSFFIGVLVVSTVLGFVCTQYEWWDNIFGWINDNTALELSLWVGFLAVVYALISYALLRKATI